MNIFKIHNLKLIIIICFLLFTLHSFSQVNILYNDSLQDIANDIERYNDNSYYLSGSYGFAGDRIKNVDSLGNLIQEVILFDTNPQTRAYNNSLEIINDKLYYLASETEYGDTITNYYFTFTCFSLNFDTIWHKEYFVDTIYDLVDDFIQTNDGGFAIVGSIMREAPLTGQGLLIKVDSIGNLQWNKEFGYNDGSETFTKIVQTADNGYILGGITMKYDAGDWYILRTDSVGNQIWDWILQNFNPNPTPDGFTTSLNDAYVRDLIKTQDGNFIAVGGKAYVNTNDFGNIPNASLVKFDINKNILLDTLYYEEYEMRNEKEKTLSLFNKIQQKPNGNFIVLNKYYVRNSFTSNMYELDNNFNLIKKREFRPKIYGNRAGNLRDFVINNNGSVTLLGDISLHSGYPTQLLWFTNTDSNYCDGFGSCDTNFKANLIFPDSVSKTDTLNIQMEIESDFNIPYNIILEFFENSKVCPVKIDTLYNIYPNEITYFQTSFKELVISVAYDECSNMVLKDTLYIGWSLTPSDSAAHLNKHSFLRDNMLWFYQPDTADTTSVIDTNDIYVPYINKKENELKLYPNPVINYLNLDLPDVLNKQDIFIYDVYGKELIIDNEELIINSNTVTINIGKLEKGVYFVKVGKHWGKFVKM